MKCRFEGLKAPWAYEPSSQNRTSVGAVEIFAVNEEALALRARASGNEIHIEEEIVMTKGITNLLPFKFGQRIVRTLLIDRQPWFVATDIAHALEYRIAGDMARNLDDDEKGKQIVRTSGGDQEMLVINESGLFAAILKSRKVQAKRFKKWVTAEVLPAIREHGRYEDSHNHITTLLGQTIGTDGFHMLGALIKGKVSSLPAQVQRRAKAKIWSQTHAAFGVRSAADIPADQLDAARNFIAAYALEGEWLPKPATVAIETGPTRRYLVSFTEDGEQLIKPVPIDACVLTHRQLIQAMLTPGDLPVSTEELFEFTMAALTNLKARSEAQARQLRNRS